MAAASTHLALKIARLENENHNIKNEDPNLRR
jgi:hypothetical protein